MAPTSEHLQIIPRPPIPRKPLKVLHIYQLQFIFLYTISTFNLVPFLTIWPHSVYIFTSFNPHSCKYATIITHFLECHSFKIKLPFKQDKCQYWFGFAVLPLGLEEHAGQTIKLFPKSVCFLINPHPV